MRISQQQLESYLWGAATLLRGTIDAGDYKQFIFPLLFYKRLCDVFDEETQIALSESGGDQQFALFPENHRFQIPPEAHWREVRQAATNVGRALQSAMRAIETANPDKLYGIFGDAQWTNKDRLSDAMLRDLVEHFSALELTLANLPEDELGNGYEYLIKKFADDSGHTAAEFYTNRTIVHLMTEMLEPQPGESIYDPTCGSGGMLLSCITHLRSQGKEWRNVRLYGQERNLMTSSIARMNCFLHGIEDFQIVRGDTLSEPKLVQGDQLMLFDVVLANPPYSIKQWDRDAFASDPWGRNLYGTPPQGRADYAFWQHILCSLATKTGRCAILFPHGVLFRQEEAEMRRKLIEADLIECVIGLGPNLFYNSPMEACVVICRTNKAKARRRKILFINAINEVTRERAQSFLTDDHIERVVGAYREFKDEAGLTHVTTLDEVRAKDWNLNLPLYVASTETTDGRNIVGNIDVAQALSSWISSASEVREALTNVIGQGLAAAELPLIPSIAKQFPSWLKRSEWTRLPFASFAESVNERVEPADAADDNYVGLEHLDSGSLHIRRSGKGSDVIGTKLRFRKGDIIFGRRRAYQRKLAVAETDGICSAHAMVVRAKQDLVLPEFLPFLMMSDKFMNRAVEISVGSLSPTINWKTLKVEEFDLPPLDQQRRIAEILWAVDDVHCRFEAMAESAAKLRKAHLHSTFAHHNTHTTLPVRETGLVQLGRQRAPKYQTGISTKPYLRVANVFDGFLDYSDVLRMDFDYGDFETYRLRAGDILLNEGQSRELVGRCAIYDGGIEECCFQNTLIRYRAGDPVLTEYAFTFFQYCFHFGIFAAISSQTTSMAHLGAERFGSLSMPVPPKVEQKRIAEEFAQMQSLKVGIADHLRKVRRLRETTINT
ncbi:MAG: N-6 DNA methylase [Acidobacteriota bacterium]